MTVRSVLLHVTSFHPGPFGGGILLGRDAHSESTTMVRARVPDAALGRYPAQGETWRVSGPVEIHQVVDRRTGRAGPAEHIIVDAIAPELPIGRGLVRWIATHPKIVGVGEAYAERLWHAFGPALYEILEKSNFRRLEPVVGLKRAFAILTAFEELADEVAALKALEQIGVDGATARAAVEVFGPFAAQRFKDNPYDLTILEPWAKIDAIALRSGLDRTDPRRLCAAVETAMAAAFRTTGHNLGGHTAVTRPALVNSVRRLLGRRGEAAASEAVEVAIASGAAIKVGGHLQSRAAWHMERALEAAIAARNDRPAPEVEAGIVDAAIAEVERKSGFRLDPGQCDAVHMAVSSNVAFIAGGAGTGKSTILRAIIVASKRLRRGPIHQMALSGRAARRMVATTGHDAGTIYRFRKALEAGRHSPLPELLIIDEVSMVSTPDLWLLATTLPEETRLLFVGDDGQLPPLQAGHPIRALMASRSIRRTVLDRPHRQQGGSDVSTAAASIRAGVVPEFGAGDDLTPTSTGVFLLSCATGETPQMVLNAFARLVGSPETVDVTKFNKADVQILTMTKKGPWGAESLSELIERDWLRDQQPVNNWGYRIGSKVLWTQNSYDRPRLFDGSGDRIDIMNGALGRILRFGDDRALVRWDDGSDADIGRLDLETIARGWAITVHKAQGSEFDAVIVPVTKSRLLDRSMLYTAVTRSRRLVVLVGEPGEITAAIARQPRIDARLQALDFDRGSPAPIA